MNRWLEWETIFEYIKFWVSVKNFRLKLEQIKKKNLSMELS